MAPSVLVGFVQEVLNAKTRSQSEAVFCGELRHLMYSLPLLIPRYLAFRERFERARHNLLGGAVTARRKLLFDQAFTLGIETEGHALPV